jgi:signal transduction histidine kinase
MRSVGRGGRWIDMDTMPSPRLDLLSMLAHDLRTPVVSIQQSCAMFTDGLLGEASPEQQEVIDLITTNATTLDKMVKDFLDIVRSVEGAAALKMAQVSLVAIVQAVAHQMRPTLRRSDVRLEVDAPADLQRVWADGEQIQRVVGNLLSNAVRYSPAGSTIAVTVRAHGEQQRVAIRDQGPGIPADELESIFGRFWQGADEVRKVSGNCGLGLFFCRTVLDRHGGRIWAESGDGSGASFTFELPVDRRTQARAAARNTEPHPATVG